MSEAAVAELKKFVLELNRRINEEVFTPGGYGAGIEIERQEIKELLEESLSKQTWIELARG